MASVFLLLLASCATIKSASSARIVGLGLMSSGSHYFLMKTVMEELAARGHEVVILVSSDYKPSRSSEVIPHKVYQVPFKSGFIEEFLVKPTMEKGPIQLIMNMVEFQRLVCESLLNSTELLQDLRNFDLIVYEGVALCGVLVGEHLGIRSVGIFSVIPSPGSYLMPPSPISYVPLRMTGFTDKMSFLQRVMNLVAYVAFRVIVNRFFLGSMAALKAKYNITPEISCGEAFGRDELVIVASDFALEYPQPLLPGQVMVGPLTVKEPNPLPAELEDFVRSNGGHGFIIVSFGSYMESAMSKERIDIFGAAFGKLKQKVLWKLKNYIPASLGPNIKTVKWLPQNDLLAHKDIKAFVSHMGINSYHESAYFGVPVVAVPLFSDQFSNAKRTANFGWGTVVDYKTVNVQEVLEAIEHVVNDPRFKKEARRISMLMQDKPRAPLKAAGDWIEYVLRHGGARHLRPQVFNIPWYQYYLLDVMAFLVSIVTLVVMVIWMTCRCLCHLCCKRSGNKPKKE